MPKEEKKKGLTFSSVGELNKISEDVKVTINNAFQCKQYCRAANEIFRKADNFYKTRDEEQAYMLFMRYFYIIQNIKKSYEFVKSKNTYMTTLKECSTASAITKAEELSTSLHSRYEKRNAELLENEENERKKAIDNANLKKSSQNGYENVPDKNKSNENFILPEVPNDFVQKTNETSHDVADSSSISHDVADSSSISPTKGLLSVTELYTLLKDYKENLDAIMVIDIRPVEEYVASRINHKCIINVPQNLLQHGANINSIERKLSNETWEVWSSRFHKKTIIIMNYEFDINVNTMSSSLFLLQDVLCKFQGSYQVLILDGGFKQWILHYPSMTTNPFYSKKPAMPILLDSTALLKDLTYPELPSSEKKRPAQVKQPVNEFKDLPPQKISTGITSSTQKFTASHGILNNSDNDEEDVIISANKKMTNLNITDKQEFHFSDTNISEKNVFIPHTTSNISQSHNASTKPQIIPPDVPTSTVTDIKNVISRQDNNIVNTSSGMNTVNTSSVTQNINHSKEDNVRTKSVNFNAIDISNTQSNTLPSSFSGITAPSHVVNQSINSTAAIKTNLVPSMPASISNNLNVVITTCPTQLNTSTPMTSFCNVPSSAPSNIPITSIPSVVPQPTTLPNNISSSILPNNVSSPILPNNVSSPILPNNVSSPILPSNVLSPILPNNVSSPILPNNVSSPILPNNVSHSVTTSSPNNNNNMASLPQNNTIPLATFSNINNSKISLPTSNFTCQPGASLPMSNYKEASSKTLPPRTNNIQPVSAVNVPQNSMLPGNKTSSTVPSSAVLSPGMVQSPMPSLSGGVPQVPSLKQPLPKSNNMPSTSHSPQVSTAQSIEHSKQPHQQPPGSIPNQPQKQNQQAPQHSAQKSKQKVTTTYGLPNGWEKAVSHETGRIYYKDHNTQSTHWTLPPEILAHVHKNESSRFEDPDKASKHTPASQSSSNEEDKPLLKRSLSSPNLADMVNNSMVPNVTEEKKLSARPVIDRSVKPKEQKQVLVDRTKKPISASRLHKLSPVYGSLSHGLTGLKNLGNTCYMNSVIQCLSNTAPLSKYFTSGLYEQDLNTRNMNSRPGEIARELSFVIIVLSAGEYRSVSPLDFKHALGRFSSQFNGSQQQDSHELLMFLLDGLHEDINKVKSRQSIKERGNDNLPDPAAADQAWSDYLLNNDSIIVSLFQGQFRSTVVCLSCGQKSKTFDAFNCLQLELPSNRSSTLQNCITSFTKAEKIGGNDSWKCSKCKCYREASKTIEVWKLPPVLIIQLKRFRCDGRWRNKIQSAVNFPLGNLNMANHVVAPSSMFSNYHLYAVINHYGSFESGHYTSYCENASTGRWYCFDDNIVKELDGGAIKTSAAYLLFYTAVDFKDYITK